MDHHAWPAASPGATGCRVVAIRAIAPRSRVGAAGAEVRASAPRLPRHPSAETHSRPLARGNRDCVHPIRTRHAVGGPAPSPLRPHAASPARPDGPLACGENFPYSGQARPSAAGHSPGPVRSSLRCGRPSPAAAHDEGPATRGRLLPRPPGHVRAGSRVSSCVRAGPLRGRSSRWVAATGQDRFASRGGIAASREP
jgi:hypothetical protein